MPGHLPSSGRARRAADRARLGARPALASPETAALSRLRTNHWPRASPPTARIFDFPAERTGFGSRRERCCPGPGGRAEARDLRAKRPSHPAAERRMAGSRWWRRMPPRTATEGIMPKSKTRKLNDTQLVILSSASQREDGLAVLPEGVRAASVKAAVIR